MITLFETENSNLNFKVCVRCILSRSGILFTGVYSVTIRTGLTPQGNGNDSSKIKKYREGTILNFVSLRSKI